MVIFIVVVNWFCGCNIFYVLSKYVFEFYVKGFCYWFVEIGLIIKIMWVGYLDMNMGFGEKCLFLKLVFVWVVEFILKSCK